MPVTLCEKSRFMRSLVHNNEFARGVSELRLPRYKEIPSIDLYMDQMIDYLEDALSALHRPGEKIITSSMVNNYVKMGILDAPKGKKYGRDNIARLIVIDILKQSFSIGEIDQLIKQQVLSFSTERAYDYFCSSLEQACRALFAEEPTPPQTLTRGEREGDFERDLVIAASATVAYTLYLKASIVVTYEQHERRTSDPYE